MKVTPFRIAVTDAAIADLRDRIDAARWPDQLDDAAWDHGVDCDYLRSLVDYWRNGFDWRSYEARINRFPQFLADVDGLDTHYLHCTSPNADATPLLMTHGWPGSIIEFLEVIPRLTDPEDHGGRRDDACHVICPSLPGYGYSGAPRTRGMGPRRVAERHLRLMDGLGYDRFVAQGGDWGAIVSRHLPDLAGDRLLGLHLNFLIAERPGDLSAEDADALCTPAERAAIARHRAEEFDQFGYAHIQGTRPQTLGYALADSPVGLCAWIAEKFRAWSGNDGELRTAISWDDLLGNVSLYWFTNTITSSIRLYREYFDELSRGEAPARSIRRPLGVAVYPSEISRPPRAWIEREHALVHWSEPPCGGHFAALEQPDIFARDLRDFVAKVRTLPVSP